MNPSNNPNIYDPYCIKIFNDTCQLCANGYFLDEKGSCSVMNFNCLKYTINGSCLACQSGYTLLFSKCIEQIKSCVDYQMNGSCCKCERGYSLKNGICLKADITCTAYGKDDQCIRCISTYYLINGKCIYPSLGFDPLCSTYTGTYCSECKPGSFLSNYRCVSIDISCL